MEPHLEPQVGWLTMQVVEMNGGRARTRTVDLLRVKQAL
jgi:hypothetical protein